MEPTKPNKYSLYLLGQAPRLINVPNPILATLEQFSSASRAATDGYSGKPYWITPLGAVRDGIHTFGAWRFEIRGGAVRWAKETNDAATT